MWGIGVFMPAKNTPLQNNPFGSIAITDRSMVLSRIIYPLTMIPITTAYHSISGELSTVEALKNAANVFMINYTPLKVRKYYQIYDNKQSLTLKQICSLIQKAGKTPSFTRGDPYYVNH